MRFPAGAAAGLTTVAMAASVTGCFAGEGGWLWEERTVAEGASGSPGKFEGFCLEVRLSLGRNRSTRNTIANTRHAAAIHNCQPIAIKNSIALLISDRTTPIAMRLMINKPPTDFLLAIPVQPLQSSNVYMILKYCFDHHGELRNWRHLDGEKTFTR
ncbi:hypothetical protein D3C79_667640 [compost metagenome]